MPTNKAKRLAELFEVYAEYLELDGQDGRAHAYKRASNEIQKRHSIPPDPAQIDGIGSTIREQIVEYQMSGEFAELEELREKYPWFEELRTVDYIGPARGQTIHEKFNVESIEDLLLVGDDLTLISGIGPATVEKIMDSARKQRSG